MTAATQNQALAALLYLYRHVLRQDLPWLNDVVRARRPRRLPWSSRARRPGLCWRQLSGGALVDRRRFCTAAACGLMECLRMRVQDIDFSYSRITVRGGKAWQGSDDDPSRR